MDKTKISALLGRPLTPIEDTNFDMYLKLAKQNLSDLICMDICSDGEPRTYPARDGYKTVFTDVFTEVDEVKLNGTVTTAYSARQWDKRNASWYNSLVFDCKLKKDDEVEIDASWGFDTIPLDLQQIIAGLFGLISKKNKFDATIKSKRVEDFHITFNTDVDLDDSFNSAYGKTIAKYSLCAIPEMSSGRVCKC